MCIFYVYNNTKRYYSSMNYYVPMSWCKIRAGRGVQILFWVGKLQNWWIIDGWLEIFSFLDNMNISSGFIGSVSIIIIRSWCPSVNSFSFVSRYALRFYNILTSYTRNTWLWGSLLCLSCAGCGSTTHFYAFVLFHNLSWQGTNRIKKSQQEPTAGRVANGWIIIIYPHSNCSFL